VFLLLGEEKVPAEILEVIGAVFLYPGDMLATVWVVSGGRLESSSNLLEVGMACMA